MTKAEALSCVAMLAASYPRHALTPVNLNAYAVMLEDLAFVDVSEAVKRLVCTSKWFPAIAEIRTEVAEAKCSELADPGLAWAEVLAMVSRCGYNGSPEWSSPAMADAVAAVGWRHICIDENIASSRARFVDAYRASRLRAVDVQRLGTHRAPALASRGPALLEPGE